MSTYRYKIFFPVAVVVLLVPLITLAGPVVRTGEEVTVEADQVVDGDLYLFGGASVISGEVQGDAYVVGGSVTHNGTISEDLVVAGGAVQIHGAVEDDVRIIGGEVTIADTISGDLVVVGGSVRVLSTATVLGDLLFLGGEITIDAPIGGSVFGFGDTLRIDASVGKDVSVTTGKTLTLGDRAEILGNVIHKGPRELIRGQGAVVVGDIQYEVPEHKANSYESFIISIGILLFGGLTILLLLKPILTAFVKRTESHYGSQGLLGLAVFIGMPVVSVLLMISVIGAIVGIIVLLLYLLILLTSWLLAGPLLGTLLWRRFKKNTGPTIVTVVFGVVIFELLFIIPFIGPLLALVIMLITIGAVSQRLYNQIVGD